MRRDDLFAEVARCFVIERRPHMQGYIDCHCHISARDFDRDIDEVIKNSQKAGLLALLAVAEHAGEFDRIIDLSQRFPGFIFPCLGVHPVQEVSPGQQRGAVLQDLDAALPLIERYRDHLVAIGEVGLDFTPRYVSGDAEKDNQRQVLIRQAQLAKGTGSPSKCPFTVCGEAHHPPPERTRGRKGFAPCL
ncbi:hypothetical protein fugu_016917 [Takifugu bimaculatus]|uniref:TatD DNase domain containing 3 n=1 Tax=Takifugu bimaculatus TaxID=433685 RepID=A0A4Z2BUC7_9TELE|nr:hypothetical protein fugu_016917 [Takifugu bimaculatus]